MDFILIDDERCFREQFSSQIFAFSFRYNDSSERFRELSEKLLFVWPDMRIFAGEEKTKTTKLDRKFTKVFRVFWRGTFYLEKDNIHR